MPQYVAFLRAINVGGHQVTKGELCSKFEEMGFRDVTTFRASGNVIFSADKEPVAKMAARIEEGLEESLGYAVPVFLRTAAEARAVAEHESFARKLVEASKGKLQVAMLSKRPTKRARTEVLALATDEDRLAFGDRELWWLPSAGTQDSDLDLKAIAKLLGATTLRTKGTVEQIAAKYFAD